MKKKTSWLTFTLVLASLVLLAACGGISPTGEEQTPEATTSAAEETAVPPTTDTAGGDIITLYVGPELVDCTGVAPQQCMQVKEDPNAEYTLFYGQIEGFTFEPGYEYELQVRAESVENPPADGSSIKYTLIDVVSQTPVSTTTTTMTPSVSGGGELAGTSWQLQSLQGAEVLADTAITAVFGSDGTLSGNAGCNTYSTSYTVDGSSLTINPMIISTMMACEDSIMQQETSYLAVLPTAVSWAVDGDTLTLSDASGAALLVYTAVTPTSLTGTTWQLTSYNNGQNAVVSVNPNAEVTAVFGEDGTLSGSAGCNTYSTSYTVDGNSLTISPNIVTTMMACAEDVMQQETAYLATLPTATTFAVQGDSLELRDANGALIASYTAASDVSLAGSSWTVISYNNGNQAAVSVMLDTEITMMFGEDGNVQGSASCNQYFGPYTVDGENITVGPLATTRAYCPEPAGIMDQEMQFLTALQSVATYTIQSGKLDMRTSDGAIAVIATSGAETTAVPAGQAMPAVASSGTAGDDRLAALANATYQVDVVPSGSVTLSGGEFSQPAAPGSASNVTVSLTDNVALGQVNGQPAAAAVLVASGGGSGSFYELALVTFADGQPQNVATAFLGDRVQVNSVTIGADGVISVDMVVQGPDDPMCCPTQAVMNTYELQNGQLVQTSSTPQG
ncbi:MAG: META domain-containing protein [Ardenticatenaceae bacterium]|nr:META domain-containing protein [Ardenticatenaceae bacterium]